MPRPSKPVTIFGKQYLSISAACSAFNVSSTTFRQRIYIEGMTPEQAVTLQPRRSPNNPCPRIRGISFVSINEALSHFNVSATCYRARRSQGWEIMTAASVSEDEQYEPCICKGKRYDSVEEMCAANNVNRGCYDERIKHRWPRSRAAALPEIITNARVPMMFPDELRQVINNYICESSLVDDPSMQVTCMIWPGNLAKSGFIEVYALRKRYSVPRLVYCMEHDVHPNDLSSRISVSPVCGNVRCIKPEHMLAVLNRRRNNGKGPRPDDQPEQDRPEDIIDNIIPPEVAAEAMRLISTGWLDTGGIAAALGLTPEQVRNLQ